VTGWRGLPPVGKSDPACSLHTRGRGNERACERTDARTDGGGKDIHENPHTSVRSSQPRVGESHLDNDLGDEVGVRGQGCGGGAQDRARRVRGDRTGEPTRSKETSARRRPLGHACAGAPIKRITVDVLFPHPPRPGRPPSLCTLSYRPGGTHKIFSAMQRAGPRLGASGASTAASIVARTAPSGAELRWWRNRFSGGMAGMRDIVQ
jgi:hypothetical protein